MQAVHLEVRRASRSPVTRATEGFKLSCGCEEPNLKLGFSGRAVRALNGGAISPAHNQNILKNSVHLIMNAFIPSLQERRESQGG